jgi:flagellar hook-associated protein 2
MIGSVYDYYLTTYASRPATKSDTHKKSELRSVYNNIVKISKKSPLYKVSVSENIQKFAIDLKENARTLSTDANNLFEKSLESEKSQKYVSDNEDVVQVKTLDNSNDINTNDTNANDINININNTNTNDININDTNIDLTVSSNADITNPDPDSDNISDTESVNTAFASHYNIEVLNLATPQINTSDYLNNDDLGIPKGAHSFEVNVGDSAYEFRFNATKDDTNKTVLEKLSRLINRSNIGLTSKMLYSGNNSALEITSNATGLGFTPEIFSIAPGENSPYDKVVSKLGLNNVSSYPTNANFLLNGMEKTTSSNTFTIGKSLEITLNGISKKGQATSISLNDDLDSVISSINDMISSYNNLLDLSNNSNEGSDDAAILNKEIHKTTRQYASNLENIGITINENGKMTFDEALFIQTANEDDLDKSLASLNSFRQAIVSRADDISINPMKYVDKVMISYPNPVHSFANPYMTSIYTGMMFNGYI